jgi:tetratricopeptide (TPR) repeat protein
MKCWPLVLLGMVVTLPATAHEGPDAQIRKLNQEITAHPNLIQLRVERAANYRRQGHLSEAMLDLIYVRDHDPSLVGLYTERARTRLALGNLIGAEQDFSEALRRQGQQSWAKTLAERAQVRTQLGTWELAQADFVRAWELSSKPEWLLRAGEIDERFQRWGKASVRYQHGLKKLHGALTVRLALIRVLRKQKSFSQAKALVGELKQGNNLHPKWQLLLGEINNEAGEHHAARKQWQQALSDINQLLKKRPNTLHRLLRARILLALGQPKAAWQDVEQVAKAAPNLPELPELQAQIRHRLVPTTKGTL